MVYVVEETLDVHREERGSMSSAQSGLDVVGKGEAGVNAQSGHNPSELFRGHERMFSTVEHEPPRDYLLDQLAKTFEELDRAIGSRGGVIRFVRFGQDDHNSRLPVWVVES